MEITGKVIAVLEPQVFTSQKNGKTYYTNHFVLENKQGQFTKKILFKVMAESDEKFRQMGIAVGGTYNVSFDVDAREYKGRWYNEILAWKVMRLDGQQSQSVPQQPAVTNNTPASDGSLPF